MKKKKRAKAIVILAVATPVAVLCGTAMSRAADPVAGKAVFETRCRTCHAALPYIGRVGEANLAAFLANPRRYNPRTAMTFPGLQRKNDIDDVIAYITGGH